MRIFTVFRSLGLATGLVATLAFPGFAADAPQKPGPSDSERSITADQAWQRLIEGNQRYASGQPQHPDQTAQRRTELASGQAPFAVILTCSDSRVAPELYFDQGLGNLFVIRNAGNILDDHVLGSIEYAVEHLHSTLLVVVGHERCGAVTAAMGEGAGDGHIKSIVQAIRPAIESVRKTPGQPLDQAVRLNARHVAKRLAASGPFLKKAAAEGHLKIVAAYYDLDTGVVEAIPAEAGR